MMEASYGFSKDSGLISTEQIELCDLLWKEGHMASLTMLGNTIFCIPGSSDPTKHLNGKGRVFELEIENKSARIYG